MSRRGQVMESVRLPNNAELERWCRAKILAALDRWQDEEISRPLATEKRRTKRKTESASAPIMRQPRRTRARRPDFGDLHAGNLLLGSNNELVAIGRRDKRFLPRAGWYKFESQEFRTRPIPSDAIKGPIQLSNACRTQRSRFDQQPSNRLKHLWQNFSR